MQKQNDSIIHLKNIIFAMGQSAVSAVNLIVESIDMGKTASLKLIDNLESTLDEYHLSLDSASYDTLKKYLLSEDDAKSLIIYQRCALSLERIGDLCSNIVKHLKNIIQFRDDLIEINEIVLLARFVKNSIAKSVMSLIQNDTELAMEALNDNINISELEDEIISQTGKIMMQNSGYIPMCMELIAIARNLERIAKHSRSITENTIYLTENKDIRNSDEITALMTFQKLKKSK